MKKYFNSTAFKITKNFKLEFDWLIFHWKYESGVFESLEEYNSLTTLNYDKTPNFSRFKNPVHKKIAEKVKFDPFVSDYLLQKEEKILRFYRNLWIFLLLCILKPILSVNISKINVLTEKKSCLLIAKKIKTVSLLHLRKKNSKNFKKKFNTR